MSTEDVLNQWGKVRQVMLHILCQQFTPVSTSILLKALSQLPDQCKLFSLFFFHQSSLPAADTYSAKVMPKKELKRSPLLQPLTFQGDWSALT